MPSGKRSSAITTEPIAVTGVGMTTCLGAGAAANWARIQAGDSGLLPVTRFATGDYPIARGGEAPEPASGPEPAAPAASLELRQLAAACLEACQQAFDRGQFPEPERAALVVGSSLAGSSAGESFFADYLARGPRDADYGLLGSYYVEGQLDSLCER